MPLMTKNQVAVRIAAVIAVCEVVTMWIILPMLPVHGTALAILDGLLLIAFAVPPIYLWVIAPFVKARDEALAQIARLAATDPLTELANRRQLSTMLERAAHGGLAHNLHGALLLVDLDRFKRVNDLYGHQVGDRALTEIARRLRSVTRAEDIVGRLGGDEFVILVNRLDADEHTAHDKALRIAQKLVEAVRMPLELDGATANVGASVGIRLLGFDDLDADTGLREADAAMYRAKQAGGERIVFFEELGTPIEPQAIPMTPGQADQTIH